jgi:small subunit ribosomal protein S17
MKGTKHRRLRGNAVSANMAKTVVVRVDRQVTHPKYKKKYTISKRFKVHDPEGKVHVGDLVEFEECRPISKDKRWRYVRTLNVA